MTYYVATLVRYVLIEAENEAQARERGKPALEELYAELRQHIPTCMSTFRPSRGGSA